MTTTMTRVKGLKTRDFLRKPLSMPFVKLDDLPPMKWMPPVPAEQAAVWSNDFLLLRRLFADHPNFLDGLSKAMTTKASSRKNMQPAFTTATHVDLVPEHYHHPFADDDKDHDSIATNSPSHTSSDHHLYKYFEHDSNSLTYSTDLESLFDITVSHAVMTDDTDADKVSPLFDIDAEESKEDAIDLEEDDDLLDCDEAKEARDDKETESPMEATTTPTIPPDLKTTSEQDEPTTPEALGSWTSQLNILPENKLTAPHLSVPPVMSCMSTKKQLKLLELLHRYMPHEAIDSPSPIFAKTTSKVEQKPQPAVVDVSTAYTGHTVNWPRDETSKEPIVPKTSLQRAMLQMHEIKKKRMMMLSKNVSE